MSDSVIRRMFAPKSLLSLSGDLGQVVRVGISDDEHVDVGGGQPGSPE